MNLLSLIFVIVICSAVAWAIGYSWRHIKLPAINKLLLMGSLFIIAIGLFLLLQNYLDIGSALIGVAGVMTAVEGYLRRRNSQEEIAPKK